MKITIGSDLHLEFGDLYINNTDNADVLILSGDICVAADLDATTMYRKKKHKTIVDFFTNCSDKYISFLSPRYFLDKLMSFVLLIAAA